MGQSSTRRAASLAQEVGPYSVRVSDAPDDPEWDDFLESAPGSAYKQTSCWGRVRASIGWQPVRVVISEDGRVVGGVQILTRPFPVGGNFGLVSHGPVVSEDSSDLVGAVFDHMLALGRANRVQYLVVYAPWGSDWMCAEMAKRGLRPSLDMIDANYTATISVDLRPDLDEMLARLRRTRRQDIGKAARRGITVRRGSEADLPTFNRLKDEHSARLGYNRREEAYYTELWRALAPRGHIELFFAEYEGEPVSVLLGIPFGDTFYHVERLWSGEHGNLSPNELLDWEVIAWAKSNGYRTTDLGGVVRSSALAALSGDEEPSHLTGWESFKLGFGGELALLPEAYDHIYNPVLRFTYRSIPPKAIPSVMGFADRVRKRVWGRREA